MLAPMLPKTLVKCREENRKIMEKLVERHAFRPAQVCAACKPPGAHIRIACLEKICSARFVIHFSYKNCIQTSGMLANKQTEIIDPQSGRAPDGKLSYSAGLFFLVSMAGSVCTIPRFVPADVQMGR
jgi:hypothetical protein